MKKILACLLFLAGCQTYTSTPGLSPPPLSTLNSDTTQDEFDEYSFLLGQYGNDYIYDKSFTGDDLKILINLEKHIEKNELYPSYRRDLKFRIYGLVEVEDFYVVEVRPRILKKENIPEDLLNGDEDFLLIPIPEYRFFLNKETCEVVKQEEFTH